MKRIKLIFTAVIALILAAGVLLFNVRIINQPSANTVNPPDVVLIDRHYGKVQEYGKIQHISLINLIATPEKFHGKLVRVQGVANFEFEGNALFLHKEDFKIGTKNAVWLSPDATTLKIDETTLAKDFNGKYVVVEGIFDMNDHGHMDLFSGSISPVSSIASWKIVPQKVSN
jgi:hypothetical protein